MWFTATTASVSNGSTIVQILSGDDIGIVQEEGGLIFEGESPVQIKRGYSDGSGNNFIELQKEWPYNDKSSQPLVAFPTDASFAEATIELRRVIDSLSVASTTEAQQGTDDEKIMTSLKTKQAIDFNTGSAASADTVSSNTDTTTGRLLTVGYGGIGGQGVAFSNWNSIPLDFSGFGLVAFQASNTPEGINPNYTYTIMITGGGSADSAIIMGQGSNIISKIRRDSSGSWTYDGLIYHSGNTNFNEFTFAQNDVKHGYARVAGQLFFEFELNGSYLAPSSISVTGTFSIIDLSTGSTVLSGITPSLSATSYNKAMILIVTGTFTRGGNYIMYADAGGATIEVGY